MTVSDTVDYKVDVQQGDIDAVKLQCEIQIPRGCRDDIKETLDRVMLERGLSVPSTPDEALHLYGELLPVLD